MSEHIPFERLVELLEDRLSDRQSRAMEAHLAACRDCRLLKDELSESRRTEAVWTARSHGEAFRALYREQQEEARSANRHLLPSKLERKRLEVSRNAGNLFEASFDS